MRLVYFLLLFFLGSSFLSAQEFLNLPSKPNGELLELVDLERSFLEWSSDKDLSQTKGWKWYARWLDENIKRSNWKGELPDQTILFKEAIKVAKMKKEPNGDRTANWTPYGPNLFPEVPHGDLLRGMGRINTVSFHPTNPNIFWVGVAQGGVWKTTNGGVSYMPLTDELPILRVSDIAIDPSNVDVMYISVGDYAYLGVALDTDARKRNTHYGLGVYKTVDGGQNWTPTGLTFEQTDLDGSLTRRVLIDPNNTQRLVAAGIHGIWRSDDGGDNWTKVFNDMIWDFEQDPSNGQVIYASTAHVFSLDAGAATILKSTNFGDTWSLLNTGIPSDEVARIEIGISASNSNYVYAHCANGQGGFYGMYRSTNGGDSWELRSDSPNILHWFDGGGNGGQGWYDMGLLVDYNNPEKLYAGGINMWASEDGGQTWKICTYWLPDFGQSVHADQHYYAYNPVDQKIYVCNDGGITRTSQIFPVSWEEINDDPNFQWTTQWEDISDGMEITSFYRLGLAPTNDNYLIAGSQDNSVFLKKTQNWYNIILGDGMECFFHPQDEEVFYAATQNGRLVRSDDGGASFVYGLTNGIDEFKEWTTPFLRHPTEPNTIYGAFGNIWKSENRGTTWTQIGDLPDFPNTNSPIHSSCLAIAPSDPNVLYVGKRIYPTVNAKGTFWRTFDEGVTMENITAGLPDELYYTYCFVDSDDPFTVWVTLGGFEAGEKVYKSSNGGDTWQNISYNLPNVPVNCVVHDPNSLSNTIYIGTDVGVFFIQDGMSEWELYSDQLPNVIVTELEIQSNTGKLFASTFGRGIWSSDLVDDISSVKEREQLQILQAQLSPNPNSGRFHLDLDNIQMKNLNLEIIDIMGRKVFEEPLTFSDDVYSKELNLDLNYGMYFLRLSHGKVSKVLKFSIQ